MSHSKHHSGAGNHLDSEVFMEEKFSTAKRTVGHF